MIDFNKVLIIAEAGVNHNGDMEVAKQLIDAAASSGADVVKFQTFKAQNLVTRDAQKAAYQKKNFEGHDNSQFSMLQRLELGEEDHYMLRDYAKSQNIEFLSTGFDPISLNFLNDFGLKYFKVPSGELTNYLYLKTVASFGKPVILSTGMGEMNEVEQAVELLINSGLSRDKIAVLHCNTDYPTVFQDVNLRAMIDIQRAVGVTVGYSDHTLGIEVPVAAVALGAKVIEKHFTLDRSMDGPDHLASLEPDELKHMVSAIRNVETALTGSGKKEVSPSEAKNKAIARKGLYYAKNLKAGHVLTEDDIIALRPTTEISAMEVPFLVGKTLTTDVEELRAIFRTEFS